jgi:hypothetical protein
MQKGPFAAGDGLMRRDVAMPPADVPKNAARLQTMPPSQAPSTGKVVIFQWFLSLTNFVDHRPIVNGV